MYICERLHWNKTDTLLPMQHNLDKIKQYIWENEHLTVEQTWSACSENECYMREHYRTLYTCPCNPSNSFELQADSLLLPHVYLYAEYYISTVPGIVNADCNLKKKDFFLYSNEYRFIVICSYDTFLHFSNEYLYVHISFFNPVLIHCISKHNANYWNRNIYDFAEQRVKKVVNYNLYFFQFIDVYLLFEIFFPIYYVWINALYNHLLTLHL